MGIFKEEGGSGGRACGIPPDSGATIIEGGMAGNEEVLPGGGTSLPPTHMVRYGSSD